ncbi:MAG: hypothetical protein D6722_11570 [Bacteroidetes bacterium]|nr:MAG: hypothetical protein D6722_11570 [Bacteroidota bacterium]
MKRILPLFLLLPFFFSSCLNEVFDMTFQYEFQTTFEMPAAEGAQEFTIMSDEFELTLLDELQERRMTQMTAASISYMRLVIPDDYKQSWRFADAAEVYMILDGEPHLLAEIEGIDEGILNILDLPPSAKEYQLMDFLERENAQLKLVIRSRYSLPEAIKVQAEAYVHVKAEPMR